MPEHEIPAMDNSEPLADVWRDAMRHLAQSGRRARQQAAAPTLALSLWRPWPWIITHLGKDVENRTWHPKKTPGRIALHAAATIDQAAAARLEDAYGQLPAAAWRTGLVAVATVAHIHHPDQCRHHGRYCSRWASPRDYHWQLSSPRPLPEAIPARGRQKLWPLTPAQRASLRLGLGGAR